MNTKNEVHHFLIVFDHSAGKLVELIEFGADAARAVEEYAAKEQELTDRPRMEIVLIGSDSLETVRSTHANYFDDSPVDSKYFHLRNIA
jgi:hypothetical protein